MFEASLLTRRLVLTPMTRDHVPDLAAIASDESIFRYIPDIRLPFDAGPWVRSMLANDGHLIRHIIRLRGTAEPVGFVQIGLRRTADLQLGYFLARSHWGRQLATEACESALTLLTDAGLDMPVYAAVHRSNSASLRVMQKLRFEPLALPRPLTGAGQDMIDHVRHPERSGAPPESGSTDPGWPAAHGQS
jgi:RimJ/RimL family protein N-acetyltransferase